MRGFKTFDAHISHCGGILSRAELLAAGWTADEVRIGVQYRWLHRLCRGWYGSSDLPRAVRDAWAHGGPLACVSALEFLGLIDSLDAADAPHVCRPSRGHRLRRASSATIHWSDTAFTSGDRWCVSRDAALGQAATCSPERLPEDEKRRRLPPPWPYPLESTLEGDTARAR